MKNLVDFIYKIKGALSEKLCDKIIEEYANEDFIRGAHPSGLEVRKLSELAISDPELIDSKNSYTRKYIDQALFETVGKCISEYSDATMPFIATSDSGYSLRKMKTGDYYRQHIDYSPPGTAGAEWKVTASMCLNDEFEGGDFTFFDKKLRFELGKGDVLIFPSTFMYPHAVEEITAGERFAIVTWFS